MTQMLEGVLVGALTELVVRESAQCDAKDAIPDRKANINKHGGKCTGTGLYSNMSAAGADFGVLSLSPHPFVAKVSVSGLAECGPASFPIQAHHLIPKNFLPTHEVCRFLSANAKGSCKVKHDTDYDNDDPRNGYCLPYATPLAEWKQARNKPNADSLKDKVADHLMSLTKRQLHQGSHQENEYDDSPEAQVDESEADDSGNDHSDDPGGYLENVGLMLDLVAMYADAHATSCKECSKDESRFPPRPSVVRHVHQVSGITKMLLDRRRIFVSERAFNYFGLSTKRATRADVPSWLR